MAINYGEAEPRKESASNVLPKEEGRTRPKLLLILDPNCWEWDAETGEYLVQPKKLPLMDGLQGVAQGGDPTLAIAHHTSRGRVVLKDGDHRLAMKDDPSPLLRDGRFRSRFVAHHSTAGKGVYCYGWAWEGYERVMTDVVWQQDIEAKRRFCRHVVAVGLVPEMTHQMRGAYMRRTVDRLRRVRQRPTADPTLKAEQVEACNVLLAALEADYAKHGGKSKQGTGRVVMGSADAADVETVEGLEMEGDAA